MGVFTARYDGRCPGCGVPITAGDAVGRLQTGHIVCEECWDSE